MMRLKSLLVFLVLVIDLFWEGRGGGEGVAGMREVGGGGEEYEGRGEEVKGRGRGCLGFPIHTRE